MAGASFTSNLDVIERVVGAAISHMAQTQLLAEGIGELLVSSVHERFKKGVGPDGEQWKKSVRAAEEGGQTLLDTGIMRNSVGYEAIPTQVACGSNDERYAIHQFGGDIEPKSAAALKFKVGGKWVQTKKVTMPARPSIGISEEDIKEARGLIHDFVAAGFHV